MDTKKSPKVSMGGASLVVIFSVLCLTVFAVLSLSTAIGEKELAQKSAQAILDYYEADVLCAQIAQEIGQMVADGALEQDIIQFAQANGLDVQQALGDVVYIEYMQEVDVNQGMYVRLKIAQEQMQILTWQVVNHAEWEPDFNLQVWDGN